jgi:hypothetical protein
LRTPQCWLSKNVKPTRPEYEHKIPDLLKEPGSIQPWDASYRLRSIARAMRTHHGAEGRRDANKTYASVFRVLCAYSSSRFSKYLEDYCVNTRGLNPSNIPSLFEETVFITPPGSGSDEGAEPVANTQGKKEWCLSPSASHIVYW